MLLDFNEDYSYNVTDIQTFIGLPKRVSLAFNIHILVSLEQTKPNAKYICTQVRPTTFYSMLLSNMRTILINEEIVHRLTCLKSQVLLVK